MLDSPIRKMCTVLVLWSAAVLSVALVLQIYHQGMVRQTIDTVNAISTEPSATTSVVNLPMWIAMGMLWASGLLLAWVVKSFFDGPVEEFTEATNLVSQGNFDVKVAPLQIRHDRWGDLHRNFLEMQHAMRSRQDAMVANNDRFRTVLASMKEGVLGIDAQGQIILANPSACKLLMLSGEVVGRKLADLVRVPELRSAIEQVRASGQSRATEFKTLHEPRKVLNVRLTALSVSKPAGMAIVFQDVTELRALETMRRDFVANVSHELKTPLASIKAYAETLLMGALNDQEQNVSFVEQIEKQADHLHLQIQDLLEIARVESGKVAGDVEPVSLNESCEHCYSLLCDLAATAKLSLKLELNEKSPVVMASAAGLETILENLVSNAISYTPAGGTVVIRTSVDGDAAVAEVQDSGIGIDVKHHDRIFERFYRVDKARSREKGGTGLGLAIVKHLAQAFKGDVQIVSSAGKGSKFVVRIPLAKQG